MASEAPTSPVPPLPNSPEAFPNNTDSHVNLKADEFNLPTDVVELDSTTVINSKPCTPAIGASALLMEVGAPPIYWR